MTAPATRVPRFGSNLMANMIGTLDDEVVIKKAETASYTLSAIPQCFPTSGAGGSTVNWTLPVIVGGGTQTHVTIQISVSGPHGDDGVLSPTTTAFAGFTESGWTSAGADTVVNTYTKASAAVGTYSITFTTVVTGSSGFVFTADDGGGVYSDQATGADGSANFTLT